MRVWLFPPFSFLLPSSLLPLKMFPLLAWPHSSRSSHWTGSSSSPAWAAEVGCSFPRAGLVPSAPGGVCRARPSSVEHCASLSSTLQHAPPPGERAAGPLQAASCSDWGFGLILFPAGPSFPGEPTANAAPWHRDTQHTLCSFGGFVLLCSGSLLQVWGHLGAAPHNLAVAWNVEFALLSPPTFSDPQLRSHTSLGTLPGPLSVCLSWQRFTE